MKKILVISPHLDDEVLGAGGAIMRHIEAGDEVAVFFIANRAYDHAYDSDLSKLQEKHSLEVQKVLAYQNRYFFDMPDERLDVSVQDMLIKIEKDFYEIQPEVVYSPFYGDNNQDHRAVFEAARVLLRPSASYFVKKWLLYEVPSSTDQSPSTPLLSFCPNYYVDIEKYIETKVRALKCYETELKNFPHPRSEEALRILAQKRGIEAGMKYAEAFMLMREIIKF